ncbi:MAG: hypothetical protein P4M05_21100 [Bradyrhizobium sp.]|nr:hypothetical protein [Bradyrhizobium sp.]
MTDKNHLEEFNDSVTTALSKALVHSFTENYRDPSMTMADVVTALKEKMEGALRQENDTAS